MKKSFIIYVLLTLVLWQLCESLAKIFTTPRFYINNPFFSIEKIANTGAAFGILENNSLALGILGILVLVLITYYVYKKLCFNDKIKIIYSAVFAAGILGNTLQRFNLGHVNDFIKINFLNFPVFNLFDVLICTSFLLFLINEVYFARK